MTPERARRAPALVAAALLGALALAACSAGGTVVGSASPSRATDPASPDPVGPLTTVTARPTPRGDTRPNLLVIEADDMRTDDLRWMPHTRALVGGRGLTFLNSFAPNPLCCPSRSSFLTGLYSHNHHVLSHEEPYGFHVLDDRSTLATALQASGYETALVGKYLNGYGIQPTRDGAPSSTYVPPGWSQWYGGLDDTVGRAGGTYDYFQLTSNVNGTVQTWPGQYTTDVTARQTEDLLTRFSRDERPAAAGRRKPWFVWWTPVAPHHGNPVEPDDPGTVLRSDGFAMTFPTPARPDAVKGRFDAQIPRGLGVRPDGRTEPDVSDKPRYLRTKPELDAAELAAETTVSRQRAEALSVLDDRVADVLGHLDRVGAGEDTVVVFTSDNGYYLGEHRKRQGKINLHEPSIRVPLLVRGPGVPVGRRFDPVTTVDLSRTLAGYGRVSLGGPLGPPDGLDLRDVISGGDRGWLRPIVLEGRMTESRYVSAGTGVPWGGLNTVGIRLGRWKLVHYATGESELYDLRADPLELDSLRPRARPGVRRALEALWREYVTCSGEACTRELPAPWRLTPAQNQALTEAQTRAEVAYYGHPR